MKILTVILNLFSCISLTTIRAREIGFLYMYACFAIYCRQLNEPVVRDVEMDGFLQHLQNEQKEAINSREEPGLHIYSSNDVDM